MANLNYSAAFYEQRVSDSELRVFAVLCFLSRPLHVSEPHHIPLPTSSDNDLTHGSTIAQAESSWTAKLA
jgi:hypothetical protein